MATPKRNLDTYPPAYLAAVQQAFSLGEKVIHCVKASPASVRMQIYGFLRVLREAGQSELADAIAIVTDYEARTVTLKLKENTDVSLDIAAAVSSPENLTTGDWGTLEPAAEIPAPLTDLDKAAADFLARFSAKEN